MECGNLVINVVMKNPLLPITYDRPNSFFEEINQNTFFNQSYYPLMVGNAPDFHCDLKSKTFFPLLKTW